LSKIMGFHVDMLKDSSINLLVIFFKAFKLTIIH
jgi:hypothetical protein